MVEPRYGGAGTVWPLFLFDPQAFTRTRLSPFLVMHYAFGILARLAF
jgi:hypothetical protein